MPYLPITEEVKECMRRMIESDVWDTRDIRKVAKACKEQEVGNKIRETVKRMHAARKRITASIPPTLVVRATKSITIFDEIDPFEEKTTYVVTKSLLILGKTHRFFQIYSPVQMVVDIIDEITETENRDWSKVTFSIHKKARSNYENENKEMAAILEGNIMDQTAVLNYFRYIGARRHSRSVFDLTGDSKSHCVEGLAVPVGSLAYFDGLYGLMMKSLKEEQLVIWTFGYLNLGWMLPKLSVGSLSESLQKLTELKERKRKREEKARVRRAKEEAKKAKEMKREENGTKKNGRKRKGKSLKRKKKK